ncbi:MAG: multiple sugar transport system permease protein [Frankiaceae bacterium]|nr:multiple sugar transport system permease protein [Frankiaceae bacterium]
MSTIESPAGAVRQPRARGGRIKKWFREGGLSTFLFFVPLLLIFGFFSFYPIVRAAIMSLQHTSIINGAVVARMAGWSNYRLVLTDPNLWIAAKNTAYFAFLAFLFGYPVPLAIAVLMSEVRRRKGLYSVLAYMPVIIPPVVAILLWKTVFFDASSDGLFNKVLGWFGMDPVPWLETAGHAMPSIVMEATWAAAGGAVIIYVAALTSVNPDLYDAAGIDGAGIFRKIWHVTLPQLRAVLILTLILQIIATAQVFLEPYLLTSGGPNNATLTVLLLIYRYAFENSAGGDYGAATALSVMLAIALAIISAVYFRLTRSWSTNS